MKPTCFLAAALAAACLTLAPGLTRAADPPPPMPQGKEWCDKNPDQCAEMRTRREAWCQGNPEQCERMRAKRAERKAWCDANPEECEKRRAERRQRMEEMRAKCEADPVRCEEKKREMRERRSGKPAAPAPASP